MAERPFMQFYGSDFVGDTLHLSTEQIGAYMLLLIAMWNANGVLPNDPKKLARVCRLTPAKWQKMAIDLLPFFETDDDEIWHKKMRKMLKKMSEKSDKNRENGRKGGEANALKYKDLGEANASNSLKRNSSIARATPEPDKERTTNVVQKKAATRGSRLPPEWEPNDDDKMWLREKAPGISRGSYETELEKFRNYWLAKSGQDATKLDWSKTWRNWMIRATEGMARAPAIGGRARPRSEADVADELLREMEQAENGNRETPGSRNQAPHQQLSGPELRDAGGAL